jgi:hypothetical protein
MGDKMEVGRLALRHEGEWWNAYWARSQLSMDGAVLLGSIRMSVAKGPVKDAFIGTMTLAFGNMVKDVTGQDPTWSEPRIAPESERSGHG